MEIITYVREGAITHKDSLGNKGRTEAGDVQVMSAGTGIRHAEFNLEPDDDHASSRSGSSRTREGGAPSWGAKPFPKGDRSGRFVVLASGFDGRRRRAADPRRGARARRNAEDGRERRVRRLATAATAISCRPTGAVEVNGVKLDARDGAAIANERVVKITALEDSELVLVDAA